MWRMPLHYSLWIVVSIIPLEGFVNGTGANSCSTYATSPVAGPENRDNSTGKDARLINCYVEVGHNKATHVYRRPGMLTWGLPAAGAAAGRGVYYWNGNVYSIFGTTLYKNL